MIHLPSALAPCVFVACCTFGCGGVVDDRAVEAGDGNDAAATEDTFDGSVAEASLTPDGTGCQVVLLVESKVGEGPTIYTQTLSDASPGASHASLSSTSDSMLTVTCVSGTGRLLRATFGPFAELGVYTVAPGALELGGHLSDRACTVSLSSAGAGVMRGFVSCPVEPYADSNIFSRSAPPIGLGAFDVKL